MRTDSPFWWWRVALFTTVIATAAWIWCCWCVFPSLVWNELRLAPSFLLAQGLPVYPASGEGPISTWIYGPVAVFLYLPAILATSAASALMAAGVINLIVVITPIVVVCLAWPSSGPDLPRVHRLIAALLCIVAWPSSSLQFIQADNACVAFGLISNLMVVRAVAGARAPGWLAATAAVLALASKQMSIGPLVAQIIWLSWCMPWKIAAGYTVRAALVGIAMGLGAVSVFGFEGLWLNMIEIPTRIPWTTEHSRRLWDLAPVLLIHLGLPVAFILGWRRDIFHRRSPLQLPSLTWLAALPLGFAALFKLGGSINSLHGLPYFLPPAVLLLFSKIEAGGGRRVLRIFPAAIVCIVFLRLQLSPAVWQPRIAHLHQGENLATQLKGEIWFPWNPLITFYSDGKIYHVEDGIYVRFITGRPLTMAEAWRHLPARWSAVALWPGDLDYGIAIHLCPPDNKITHTSFWTIRTWRPPKYGTVPVTRTESKMPFEFTAVGGQF